MEDDLIVDKSINDEAVEENGNALCGGCPTFDDLHQDNMPPQVDQDAENSFTDKLAPYLESIDSSIDKLLKYFEANVLYNQTQDKAIDQMHSELQAHRKNLYFQLLKPIVMELIELRESINRITKQYATKLESEQAIPLHIFSSYSKDLENILENNSIMVSRSNEGDNYDSTRHIIVETMNTNNPDEHHKIKEIFSDGYSYNQKALIKEKLSVFVYTESHEDKVEEE